MNPRYNTTLHYGSHAIPCPVKYVRNIISDNFDAAIMPAPVVVLEVAITVAVRPHHRHHRCLCRCGHPTHLDYHRCRPDWNGNSHIHNSNNYYLHRPLCWRHPIVVSNRVYPWPHPQRRPHCPVDPMMPTPIQPCFLAYWMTQARTHQDPRIYWHKNQRNHYRNQHSFWLVHQWWKVIGSDSQRRGKHHRSTTTTPIHVPTPHTTLGRSMCKRPMRPSRHCHGSNMMPRGRTTPSTTRTTILPWTLYSTVKNNAKYYRYQPVWIKNHIQHPYGLILPIVWCGSRRAWKRTTCQRRIMPPIWHSNNNGQCHHTVQSWRVTIASCHCNKKDCPRILTKHRYCNLFVPLLVVVVVRHHHHQSPIWRHLSLWPIINIIIRVPLQQLLLWLSPRRKSCSVPKNVSYMRYYWNGTWWRNRSHESTVTVFPSKHIHSSCW